ncbi:hypothetical protein JCM17823_23230 [Halorubrum gandharaense]
MSDRPADANDEPERADDRDSIHERDDTAMTDDSTTHDPPTDDPDASPADSRFAVLSAEDARAVLDRVALGLLVLLALLAGWSFYSYTGTAIELWVDDAYQPFALAAFNLAVLLAALAGIVHQLGRLRTAGSSAGDE